MANWWKDAFGECDYGYSATQMTALNDWAEGLRQSAGKPISVFYNCAGKEWVAYSDGERLGSLALPVPTTLAA